MTVKAIKIFESAIPIVAVVAIVAIVVLCLS